MVVDHGSGRMGWAAPGRDQPTLARFFDALGEERCAQITHVSADGADWIANVVADRCRNAVRCADPFHVVKWATAALDEVRREAWNTARKSLPVRRRGRFQQSTGHAKALKHARFALWKNPENLTTRQCAKLEWIAKCEPRLHRAYLLKEGLRLIFRLPHDEAVTALDGSSGPADPGSRRSWPCNAPSPNSARRSWPPSRTSLSNGRIEAVNTKIRLITRLAFGFASPDALFALAMLNLGDHRPTLPGRG